MTDFSTWLHSQPCAACGSRYGIQAAHVRPKSTGGTWTIPLCLDCHIGIEHTQGKRALLLKRGEHLLETMAHLYARLYAGRLTS